MGSVKYKKISDETVLVYLNVLIGKIYKILCMMEEKDPTLNVYVASLNHEISGLHNMFYDEGDKKTVLQMLLILEPFANSQTDFPHDVYKREVFKCIDLVNKIIHRKEGEISVF